MGGGCGSGKELFHSVALLLSSCEFLPISDLTNNEKCLYQFAFAANRHSRKPFEPSAFRNFWVFIKPRSKNAQLIGSNASISDAIKQMFQKRWRKVLPSNPRHENLRRKILG